MKRRFPGRLDRSRAPHSRAEGESAAAIVGVLATESECVHWLRGIGWARVVLEVSEAVVARWAFDSLPFMRNHGWEIDDVIGRVRELRIEDGELVGDFHFDPDLGARYREAAVRGTLTDLSVGFSIQRVELVEEGTDATIPLYLATEWEPLEGSLVWRGADTAAGLRRDAMDPDKIRKYLRAELKLPEVEVEAIVAELANEKTAERADETADLDTEAISAAIIRHLVARGAQSAPQPTPTPTPTAVPASSEPTPLAKAQAQAIDLGVDPAVVKRAADECDGDAGRFGLAIRKELQRTQKVPEIKTQPITGGEPQNLRALKDAETLLLARAMPHDETQAAAAAKIDSGWRSYPLFALVERVARAFDPKLPVVTNKRTFLRQQMARRFVDADLVRAEGLDGRFVRAGGELLPGDLPTLFGNVFWKVLLPSYEKDRLPLDQLARFESFRDLRLKRLIEIDIAGRFEALGRGGNLRQLVLREREGTMSAKPYGHILCIGYSSILNDDMGALVQVPMKMGEWAATMESTAFQLIVIAGPAGGYTGAFDVDVADPTTGYADDLETIRQLALAQSVVPAGGREDPRNSAGRHRALIPTVMLYSPQNFDPWFTFGVSQNLTLQTRAELRNSYQETLYANSFEGLELPDSDYYVWPGPASSACPLVWGRVDGEAMSMTVHPTAPEEQDGLKFRIAWTFGAGFVRDNAAYRVH